MKLGVGLATFLTGFMMDGAQSLYDKGCCRLGYSTRCDRLLYRYEYLITQHEIGFRDSTFKKRPNLSRMFCKMICGKKKSFFCCC